MKLKRRKNKQKQKKQNKNKKHTDKMQYFFFFYIVNNSMIVTQFDFPCRCTFKNIFQQISFFFFPTRPHCPVETASWEKSSEAAGSAPFHCVRARRSSLLQGHDLHRLAVQRDRVFYARGDRCHGHLDRPVALGQAGHHSLVHADGDLDQTLGERTGEGRLLKPVESQNAGLHTEPLRAEQSGSLEGFFYVFMVKH